MTINEFVVQRCKEVLAESPDDDCAELMRWILEDPDKRVHQMFAIVSQLAIESQTILISLNRSISFGKELISNRVKDERPNPNNN